MTEVELDVAHYTFTTRCGCNDRTDDAEFKPFYRDPYVCVTHGASEVMAVTFVPAQTAPPPPEPEPAPVPRSPAAVELEPDVDNEEKPVRVARSLAVPRRILDACSGDTEQAARVFAVVEPIVRANHRLERDGRNLSATLEATRTVTNRHLSTLAVRCGENTLKLLKLIDAEVAEERRRVMAEGV